MGLQGRDQTGHNLKSTWGLFRRTRNSWGRMSDPVETSAAAMEDVKSEETLVETRQENGATNEQDKAHVGTEEKTEVSVEKVGEEPNADSEVALEQFSHLP